MPIYTYKCECGEEEEYIVRIKERDTKVIVCGKCGERMNRGVDAPVIGKPAFRPGAILRGGRKVDGHWGKAAKLEKK